MIFLGFHLFHKSMSFRIPEIEISGDDPFKHDALDRGRSVNFVKDVLKNAGDRPLVLAIDSPYGTGKSAFVNMLGKVLESDNFQTVYFNAWKADHVSDPLIAMVAALDEAMPRSPELTEKMVRVKKVAGILLKRAAIIGVKLGTAGVLDLSDDLEEAISETASDATSDIIESFEKEGEAAKSFRIELENAVAGLSAANKQPTLIFFVDELDRCRPDFAISLLERVKHMFDVPNIAFVLSVDKKQLEAVTASVYGERINATEYLRKFIDLEFGLPSPSKEAFIRSAIQRAGLSENLNGRKSHEQDQVIRFLTMLAHVYDLSLRAIERCIVRLKLVLMIVSKANDLHTVELALLVVLRSADKEAFDQIVGGKTDGLMLMSHLRRQPGGVNHLQGLDGTVLEAMLIAELSTAEFIASYRKQLLEQVNNPNTPTNEGTAVHQKLQMLDAFNGNRFGGSTRLKKMAEIIDIAASVRT